MAKIEQKTVKAAAKPTKPATPAGKKKPATSSAPAKKPAGKKS